MAQLMPLPLTVSCSSKIQIGFTFLVPAHPGSPGKRAVKRVCVFINSTEVVVSLKCFCTDVTLMIMIVMGRCSVMLTEILNKQGGWSTLLIPLVN